MWERSHRHTQHRIFKTQEILDFKPSAIAPTGRKDAEITAAVFPKNALDAVDIGKIW